LEKEQTEAREHLLEELEVGETRTGTVGNITDFGAFVDLGGVDGLVHISDMSWGSVEKVSDMVKPGQQVEVRVLKIDKKRNRISLGMKQALPDPWEHVQERYPVNTQLKARVVRLADFGVFAELEPGVEGLVPMSEMGWSRVRQPSDVVNVGDMIDVVVIRVEMPKRRIALSIKQAQADPWAGVLESYTPQSLVKGKVTRLADFGAFVELAPGIEGLVHISELADRRVRSCSEVVEPGQEVEVRVLGVDAENRRISLSIRAVAAPEAAGAMPGQLAADRAGRERKKRKRPLRGGLSWEWEG
jgi:small subunit ribosomal protein S1